MNSLSIDIYWGKKECRLSALKNNIHASLTFLSQLHCNINSSQKDALISHCWQKTCYISTDICFSFMFWPLFYRPSENFWSQKWPVFPIKPVQKLL